MFDFPAKTNHTGRETRKHHIYITFPLISKENEICIQAEQLLRGIQPFKRQSTHTKIYMNQLILESTMLKHLPRTRQNNNFYCLQHDLELGKEGSLFC